MIEVATTELAGVKIVTPPRFQDARGFFSESWQAEKFRAAGIDADFVQDNHSFSALAGTVRGLHFQSPPRAQAKLVRCTRGRLIDVAVDLRKSSPTFGRSVCVELSFENGKHLFIPEGFAHGFVTLVDETEISYKCSDYYAPDCDRSLAFDDLDLSIDWGMARDAAHLSEKDAKAPSLKELDNPF